MKLEEGMYVRTIGGIERLKKENDNGWFFALFCTLYCK